MSISTRFARSVSARSDNNVTLLIPRCPHIYPMSVVRAEAGLKIRTDRGCLARSNELSPPREPALAPEDRIKSLSGPNQKDSRGRRVAGGRKRKRAQGRRKDREKEIGKGKQEEELGGRKREREKRRERFREYYFVMCVVSDNTYHIYNMHTTLANLSLD